MAADSEAPRRAGLRRRPGARGARACLVTEESPKVSAENKGEAGGRESEHHPQRGREGGPGGPLANERAEAKMPTSRNEIARHRNTRGHRFLRKRVKTKPWAG